MKDGQDLPGRFILQWIAAAMPPAAPGIAETNAVWPLAVILPAAWASAPGWSSRPAN